MRWISTVAGVIATAAGVLVVVSLSQGEATPPPPDAQPQIVVATTVPETTTEVVTLTIPDIPVSGLDPAVSDALITSGYTEFVGEGDLGSVLSPEVALVLTEEGAVLVIADGEDG
jgi:hypothetical protein